ncbi:hypothetical protein ACQKGL_03135 [Ensifer adhaerens]|uniref:hypothetical protein n=1 Tax=Ensifer adhaerens TaxID=106592 RepID=UPI003D016996
MNLFRTNLYGKSDVPERYQHALTKLREDMEHRIQVALAEARAFAEEQSTLNSQASFERTETRASLASTEAKAYADEGLSAVAKSLGATAKMTLHLSRRIEAMEKLPRCASEEKTEPQKSQG